MSQSIGVSARSALIAGMSIAVVGAATVAPVSAPEIISPAKIASALELTSITSPIEAAIKNTYNAVEPWAEYGMSWADYVLGLIPVVNWFAPAIPLAYYTAEPLVRAGTYTFADVVGLDFAQIGPDINTGITNSINNAITYALAWANIPLPPPLPFAASALPAAATDEGISLLSYPSNPGPVAPTAITNLYGAVEPWANYAAEWGQYILGFIPGLWWLAPAVPLGYNTIEPLVASGVYSFSDLINLNFAAIGPDISNGINASINNGIYWGGQWLQSLIPFPPLPPLPPFPGAAVAASAASLPAPAEAATASIAVAEAPSIAGESATDAAAEDTTTESAPTAGTPAVEAPASETPVAEAPADEAPAAEAPEVEAPADEAPAVEAAPTVDDAAAMADDTAVSDEKAPAASAGDTDGSGQQAQRPSRSGRYAD